MRTKKGANGGEPVCSTPLSVLLKSGSAPGKKRDPTGEVINKKNDTLPVATTVVASPENQPDFVEGKVSNDIRKQIVKKIHRYIQQHKLSEHEIDYIHRLLEMDITSNTGNSKQKSAENETGTLFVVNNYSDATFQNVINFLSECEQNWNKKKEDAQFPKLKTTQSKDTAANKKPPVKKVKVMANPLIKDLDSVVQSDAESNAGGNTGATGTDKAANAQPNKNLAKHPLEKKLRIIDNKKHPLAFYKGPFNRIMRTARNIGSNSGIPEHNKKYTSELLGSGQEIQNVSVMGNRRSGKKELVVEVNDWSDNDNVSEVNDVIENDGNDGNDGNDDDNDAGSSEIEPDAFEQLSRKYTADDGDLGDDIGDDINLDLDVDDDDDDGDGDEDEDGEDELEGSDAAGDDDDDNESSGVEYSE